MVRARVLTIAMLVVIALGVAATVGLMKTAQTPARIPTSPAAGEDAVDFDERAPSPSPDERELEEEMEARRAIRDQGLDAGLGEVKKMVRVKENLKRHWQAGRAFNEPNRRMLRHLCQRLGDPSCRQWPSAEYRDDVHPRTPRQKHSRRQGAAHAGECR